MSLREKCSLCDFKPVHSPIHLCWSHAHIFPGSQAVKLIVKNAQKQWNLKEDRATVPLCTCRQHPFIACCSLFNSLQNDVCLVSVRHRRAEIKHRFWTRVRPDFHVCEESSPIPGYTCMPRKAKIFSQSAANVNWRGRIHVAFDWCKFQLFIPSGCRDISFSKAL